MNKENWVKVTNRLPEHNGYTLVFFPVNEDYGNLNTIDICFFNLQGHYWDQGNFKIAEDGIEPTHWMPLPNIPKED